MLLLLLLIFEKKYMYVLKTLLFGIWRIFQFQIFLILFFSRRGICNRNTISSTFVQILAPKKWMACMVWHSFHVRCYLPKIFIFFKSQKKQTEQRRASWWWVWEKSWCKCINKENQENPRPKREGKKSSHFLSGYISQAPWNLGPISISFMHNLSLFGNSLNHSLPNSSSSSSSSSLSHPSPATTTTILESMETPSQPWQSYRHQQQQQHWLIDIIRFVKNSFSLSLSLSTPIVFCFSFGVRSWLASSSRHPISLFGFSFFFFFRFFWIFSSLSLSPSFRVFLSILLLG